MLKKAKAMLMQFLAKRKDLIYLVILIALIKVAVDKKSQPETHAVLTAPAGPSLTLTRSAIKAEALVEDEEPNTLESHEFVEAEPFTVHEADVHILKQIDIANQQIDDALSLIGPTKEEVAQLQSIKRHLIALKKQYQHTSPALALLGPMATAGIVLKEQRLETTLLKTINQIGNMLYVLAEKSGEFQEAESVAQGLVAIHETMSDLKHHA